MPDIALTGSSGHLGYVIHKLLAQEGIADRLLLRKPMEYVGATDHVIYGALEETAKRKALVQDCKTVVHCAGKVWPKTGRNPSVLAVNYEMTKALYRDAVEAGVKHFIFISSIHSMKVPALDREFNESASLVDSPENPYDYSKAEAERFLNSREGLDDISITILNPTAIIGPGDHYIRGLNQLFDRLHRKKLPAITSGGFDVVDVRDVAMAVIEVFKRCVAGKFMLAGKYYSMVELANIYGELSSINVTRRVIQPGMMKFLARISKPLDRLASKPLPLNTYSVETLLEGHPNIRSSAALEAFDYVPRPIGTTLFDLHQWFSHQKLIL